MVGKRSSQARPSSPKSSSIKLAKSSGMINKLFLLRSVSDVSDCSLPEAARKGKRDWVLAYPQTPAGRPLHPLATSGGDGGARIKEAVQEHEDGNPIQGPVPKQ